MSEIIAYSEWSLGWKDQQTIRKEWRIRLLEQVGLATLNAAWGPRWPVLYPGSTHVIEQRYVRDGNAEPWKPHHPASSREDALRCIPHDAISVDPELIALQKSWRLEAQELAQKKAEEDRDAQRRAEEEAQQEQSQAAFARLTTSPSAANRRCAEAWNTFVKQASDRTKARVRVDPELRPLYDAVMMATDVPSKRRAIREFLEAV